VPVYIRRRRNAQIDDRAGTAPGISRPAALKRERREERGGG